MSGAVYVQACALWSPQYPRVSAWLAGERSEPPVSAPAAELLPRRTRGRASLLTAMIAEVVERAARDAGAELSTVPVIVGSVYGEIATTEQLLLMMGSDDGALSPARFQGSVHNAAAGSVSIATANRSFGNCLSAGQATAAAVLMEAHAWLAAAGGQVIAVAADEALPGFFSAYAHFSPLAVALLLSAEPGPAALASLGPPLHASAAVEAGAPEEPGADTLTANPAAPLLAVLRALYVREPAVVALPGLSGSWRFEVAPSEAAQ